MINKLAERILRRRMADGNLEFSPLVIAALIQLLPKLLEQLFKFCPPETAEDLRSRIPKTFVGRLWQARKVNRLVQKLRAELDVTPEVDAVLDGNFGKTAIDVFAELDLSEVDEVMVEVGFKNL